jgi:YHS domain-containing protein
MAFLGFVVDFLGPEPPAGVRAGTAELIVANRYTGVAINGFDPVAYFVDTVPRLVRADLEWRYEGVTWRFANEGNRAAFAANPEIYMPRFGGHDPVAAARGVTTPGNAQLWQIAEQRLYLFHSDQSRAVFLLNPEQAIETAERLPEAVQSLVR